MRGSMVDIQSATTEISRGKKKKLQGNRKNIMSASATQGGHNYIVPAVAIVHVSQLYARHFYGP